MKAAQPRRRRRLPVPIGQWIRKNQVTRDEWDRIRAHLTAMRLERIVHELRTDRFYARRPR